MDKKGLAGCLVVSVLFVIIALSVIGVGTVKDGVEGLVGGIVLTVFLFPVALEVIVHVAEGGNPNPSYDDSDPSPGYRHYDDPHPELSWNSAYAFDRVSSQEESEND